MDSKNSRNSRKNESTTSLNSLENGSIYRQDATEVRCAVCGKPNAKKCTRCKEIALCTPFIQIQNTRIGLLNADVNNFILNCRKKEFINPNETGQSVGGAKAGEPQEKSPGTPASRTWLLSYVPRIGLKHTQDTAVAYCNKDCQSKHWPVHKSDCKSNQERHKDEHSFNSTGQKQADKQSDISNNSKTNDNVLSSDKDKHVTGLEQNDRHEGEQNIEDLSTKSVQANDSEGITNDKENQFSGVEAQPSKTETQMKSTSNNIDQNQEAEGDTAEKGDAEPQIDIQDILNDTAIRNAFMDPTIDKAIREIKQDPLNIGNYKENEKLKDLIELVTQKLTSKTNVAQ